MKRLSIKQEVLPQDSTSVTMEDIKEAITEYSPELQEKLASLELAEKRVHTLAEALHSEYQSGTIKPNPRAFPTNAPYPSSLKASINRNGAELMESRTLRFSLDCTPYEIPVGYNRAISFEGLAIHGMTEHAEVNLRRFITGIVLDDMRKESRAYAEKHDPKTRMIKEIRAFEKESGLWLGNDIGNYGNKVPLEVVEALHARLPEIKESWKALTNTIDKVVAETGAHRMTEEHFGGN